MFKDKAAMASFWLLAFASAAKAVLLKSLLVVMFSDSCSVILDADDLTGLFEAPHVWAVIYMALGACLLFSTAATSIARDVAACLNDTIGIALAGNVPYSATGTSRRLATGSSARAMKIARFPRAFATDLCIDAFLGCLTIFHGYLLLVKTDWLLESVGGVLPWRATTIRVCVFKLLALLWVCRAASVMGTLARVHMFIQRWIIRATTFQTQSCSLELSAFSRLPPPLPP